MSETMLAEIRDGIKAMQTQQAEEKKLRSDLEARILSVEQQFKQGRTVAGVHPDTHEGKRGLKLVHAIRGMKFGEWQDADYERDLYATSKKRALDSDIDSQGGFLVPPEHRPELIEQLKAEITAINMPGVMVLDNVMGSPLTIPRKSGAVTASFGAINVAATESNQTFEEIELKPHALKAAVRLDNRLVRLASPAAEAIIRQDLIEEMGLAADLKVYTGTGVGNEPLGIKNTPSVNTVAFSNLSPTYEKLVDMVTELDNDNVKQDFRAWTFHSKIRGKLAKVLDGDSRPLFWNMLNWGGQTFPPMADLIGYPWKISTQLPTNLGTGASSDIFLGRWRDFVFAFWMRLEILASNVAEDVFLKDQTIVRAIHDCDWAVRHPESFVVGTNVLTT